MAKRNIVKFGEDILRKKCREVTVFDDKLWVLLDDMYETMKPAFNAITKEMVENWVKDLVYGKTYCGLKFQTAIISAIASQMGKEWREANPEEEAHRQHKGFRRGQKGKQCAAFRRQRNR